MSGAYVPYHLRLNKAVERRLFVDLLTRVDRVRPIDQYKYISFGGAFLEDFKLVHNAFGICEMVSIEEDGNTLARQNFNRPFACIECLGSNSHDYISEFVREDKDVVVWLDYANANEHRVQIDEFGMMLRKLSEYDVLKLTLNANPNSLGAYGAHKKKEDGSLYREDKDQTHIARLNKFLKMVDDEYCPPGISCEDMTRDAFPVLLNEMIQIASEKAMKGKLAEGLYFQHLTSFLYADSEHQMLTVTGIVLSHAKTEEFADEIGLSEWGHGGLDWGVVERIQIPAFSVMEKCEIDSLIHKMTDAEILDHLGFLFDKDRDVSEGAVANYRKYYRYYPNFQRVEA
ncbi:MAG: hypothetical protein K9M17_06720 [Mariprofundaceae bacterium]|nr:hypothetical protein [Mariprofundaceae bacterium]